jgi:SAM-dependent methyltransferase
MGGAEHFDAVAGQYASARPAYPAELWADVFATGLVTTGRRALDLGAGTGEATSVLLSRGMSVTAVEPGERLAAILAARCPSATVVRRRAEELQLTPGSADLVVAATSVHWLALDLVLPILHRAIAPGGRLAVWRNVFGDGEATVTPFRREIERIRPPASTARTGHPEDLHATAEALTSAGLFRVVSTHRYRWQIDLDAAQVRDLFTTFSDWSPGEVEQASSAVSALGGMVTEHYSSWLILAEPVPGADD